MSTSAEGLSTAGFAENIRARRAYVTRRPLIRPEMVFGTDLRIRPGEERQVAFELTAVAGPARAALVGPAGEIATRAFETGQVQASAEFAVTGGAASEGCERVALTVEDADGSMACSDPI